MSSLIGRKIYRFETLSSTNDKAKELVEEKDVYGIVVVAKKQTRGRGQFERVWVSPKGGLYLSIILKPRLAVKDFSQITLWAGRVLQKSLNKILKVDLKEPNDILVKEKKLAGILAEAKREKVILGIGINVNSEVSELPSRATSLKIELKRKFDLKKIETLILVDLDKAFEKEEEKWQFGG